MSEEFFSSFLPFRKVAIFSPERGRGEKLKEILAGRLEGTDGTRSPENMKNASSELESALLKGDVIQRVSEVMGLGENF